MKRRLHGLRGGGGAEIAEFAIVLPILLMVIFAVYSFGRAYNIYTTITRAAQEGAEIAAMPSTCGTCPTPGAPPCSGGPATTYPGDPCVANTVSSILQASHIDPTKTCLLPSSPCPAGTGTPFAAPLACPAPAPAPVCTLTASPTVEVCRNAAMNNPTSTGPCELGVLVRFEYPYQLLPMLSVQSIAMPAQGETRIEY
jgi:TadE-like protein